MTLILIVDFCTVCRLARLFMGYYVRTLERKEKKGTMIRLYKFTIMIKHFYQFLEIRSWWCSLSSLEDLFCHTSLCIPKISPPRPERKLCTINKKSWPAAQKIIMLADGWFLCCINVLPFFFSSTANITNDFLVELQRCLTDMWTPCYAKLENICTYSY